MSEAVRKVIIKKVRKKHGEGHHGGSWKVAYADFVTAMMAFFLLLWLLSMVSTEKRAVMAEYFKNFSLFKESALVSAVGMADLMFVGQNISNNTARPVEVLTAVALVYFVIAFPLTRLVTLIERRMLKKLSA